jgi:hypothetical protein
VSSAETAAYVMIIAEKESAEKDSIKRMLWTLPRTKSDNKDLPQDKRVRETSKNIV